MRWANAAGVRSRLTPRSCLRLLARSRGTAKERGGVVRHNQSMRCRGGVKISGEAWRVEGRRDKEGRTRGFHGTPRGANSTIANRSLHEASSVAPLGAAGRVASAPSGTAPVSRFSTWLSLFYRGIRWVDHSPLSPLPVTRMHKSAHVCASERVFFPLTFRAPCGSARGALATRPFRASCRASRRAAAALGACFWEGRLSRLSVVGGTLAPASLTFAPFPSCPSPFPPSSLQLSLRRSSLFPAMISAFVVVWF